MNEPHATSFVLESNIGGLPITLCVCGVLLYQPMADPHMRQCVTYLTEIAGDIP